MMVRVHPPPGIPGCGKAPPSHLHTVWTNGGAKILLSLIPTFDPILPAKAIYQKVYFLFQIKRKPFDY